MMNSRRTAVFRREVIAGDVDALHRWRLSLAGAGFGRRPPR